MIDDFFSATGENLRSSGMVVQLLVESSTYLYEKSRYQAVANKMDIDYVDG